MVPEVGVAEGVRGKGGVVRGVIQSRRRRWVWRGRRARGWVWWGGVSWRLSCLHAGARAESEAACAMMECQRGQSSASCYRGGCWASPCAVLSHKPWQTLIKPWVVLL